MNAHAPHPLTAEIAEHLLDGHPIARRHAHGLAERLAAATTAAFPGELAGEDAAVAAFLAVPGAHLTPRSGRTSMMKSAVVAKLLTLKAAVIAVAAVSAGGVALAASTGVLPNPLSPNNPGSHSTDAPDHTRGPNATPSPSLIGLCTAYLAGAGAEHDNALQNPAFTALITAADGPDNVDAYCTGLGVTAPGSNHASPTTHPTGEPSHPNPTSKPPHPTGAPTSHPAP